MARMPDIEAEAAAALRRAQRHLPHPEPSEPSSSSHQEVPVSPGSEFHRWAAVAETFGEDAIAILEAAASNPEVVALIVAAARVAHLPLAPGTIAGAAGAVRTIEATWKAAQTAQAAARQQQPAPAPADGTGAQPAQQPQGQM